MAKKKEFFSEPTVVGIAKKLSYVPYEGDGLARTLLDLSKSEYTVLDSGLIVPREFKSARKFMKHGPEVKPKRFYTTDKAVQDTRAPVQLREEAFDNLKDPFKCGYSILPMGIDRRKRKISLTECMEGAGILAQAHQTEGEGIFIKPYDDARRVRQDGAEILARVPSREEGEGPFEFKLISVPVVDSKEKHKISLGIGSDHSCNAKRFNIRYRYSDDKESSGIVNLCAHEIAGYLKVIDHYINNKKNIIPLQMSQFAIPSQEAVDFYLRLGNNVLVKDPSLKSKHQLRKLNRAEREIALWDLVKTLGHDKTFYSKGSRDGNVADYNWGA